MFVKASLHSQGHDIDFYPLKLNPISHNVNLGLKSVSLKGQDCAKRKERTAEGVETAWRGTKARVRPVHGETRRRFGDEKFLINNVHKVFGVQMCPEMESLLGKPQTSTAKYQWRLFESDDDDTLLDD
ncbi:unnamed protein product [Allacma fusca]|uniref:Uncharacterized protein n=1 Tax=Allacma fusca TaxID=39272 RepID=A0A8J2L7K3_9HEXA|nr:unnamed protein product [Allacma fusca]